MGYEFEKLKLVLGKKVIGVQTEISSYMKVNYEDNEIQVEIPLRIGFEEYTLTIYNKWHFNRDIKSFKDFSKETLINFSFVNEVLDLEFSNSIIISIDFNDEGFLGPEALVLHGLKNLIVVWN